MIEGDVVGAGDGAFAKYENDDILRNQRFHSFSVISMNANTEIPIDTQLCGSLLVK